MNGSLQYDSAKEIYLHQNQSNPNIDFVDAITWKNYIYKQHFCVFIYNYRK